MLIFCFTIFPFGVYGYVIHVYREGSSCDLFVEYHVHHGLERRWGVGESKEHHCWFKESSIGYESHLVSVFFYYLDRVVSPTDIYHCDQFSISYSVDQLWDEW